MFVPVPDPLRRLLPHPAGSEVQFYTIYIWDGPSYRNSEKPPKGAPNANPVFVGSATCGESVSSTDTSFISITAPIRYLWSGLRVVHRRGLDNAGKTTIIKKLNDEDVRTVSPTLGFNIKTFVHGKYTLNIWDVGGQRTLRPYWRNYFEQTDALVWVVDSSDRMRMEDCKTELHALLMEERLAGASLLVFANKQDIGGAMTDAEIREALALPSIKTHHWRIQACSAITGEHVKGLEEGLDWVVTDVARRLYWGSLDTTAVETQVKSTVVV